jgi:hypothetical protein
MRLYINKQKKFVHKLLKVKKRLLITAKWVFI